MKDSVAIDLPLEPDWHGPAIGAAFSAGLYRSSSAPKVLSRRLAGQLCYLATPYTLLSIDSEGNWSSELSLKSGREAALWQGMLMRAGITAISPISQAAAMIDVHGPVEIDPLDDGLWQEWCAPLLEASDCTLVPLTPGYQASRGVWHEVRETLMAGREVHLIGWPD